MPRYGCMLSREEDMPVVINDHTWYRTVGINGNTILRWLKEEMVSDVQYRDCRGWRLFTAAQVETIRTKTDHITAVRQNS